MFLVNIHILLMLSLDVFVIADTFNLHIFDSVEVSVALQFLNLFYLLLYLMFYLSQFIITSIWCLLSWYC